MPATPEQKLKTRLVLEVPRRLAQQDLEWRLDELTDAELAYLDTQLAIAEPLLTDRSSLNAEGFSETAKEKLEAVREVIGNLVDWYSGPPDYVIGR